MRAAFNPAALAGILAVLAIGRAGAAHAEENRSLVEAVMSRAVLERGAFLACARHDNDADAIGALTRGWKADIADTVALLRQSGYAQDYIGTIAARFDLDTAVPTFADRSATAKFCAMLGDWKQRYALFFFAAPSVELKRSFQH